MLKQHSTGLNTAAEPSTAFMAKHILKRQNRELQGLQIDNEIISGILNCFVTLPQKSISEAPLKQ